MNKYLNAETRKTGDVCKSRKNWYKDKIFLSLNDLDKVKQYKNDVYRLTEVFSHLFDTENLWDFTCYTKSPKQCSDGSDLYTLIKYEGKDTIVKVGAWEFNTQVFTTGGVPELKGFYRSPMPLFVVNQHHSYLGSDADRLNRFAHAKQYLNECAVIVVPKWWEAHFRGPRHAKEIDYGPIHIRHYDDALVTGRLALVQKAFPNGQFQKAVDILSKRQRLDFDAFYSKIYKNASYLSDDDNTLLWCLRDMGISRCGSGVGDKKAYQWLYDLVHSFDTSKQVFTLWSHMHA